MLWIVDWLPRYDLLSHHKKIHLIESVVRSIRKLKGSQSILCHDAFLSRRLFTISITTQSTIKPSRSNVTNDFVFGTILLDVFHLLLVITIYFLLHFVRYIALTVVFVSNSFSRISFNAAFVHFQRRLFVESCVTTNFQPRLTTRRTTDSIFTVYEYYLPHYHL